MVVLSLVMGISEQDDFANIPDLQTGPGQHNQNTPSDKRLPGGNSTMVQGQHPLDEAEPHSSVSDLANSLTSEMLMLSPGSEDDNGHEGPGREKLGRIQFSVGYNFQDSTLTVKILKGQELPAKDFSGTSDPFVKIYLLPDKKNKLETKGSRGELLLSLCYNPTANTITVNIIKARNLKAMDIGGTSDPYVKLWLMHKDKRVEKKKTVVMKCCLNPVFNESFPFEIPTERLRDTTIIITVMDKDRLSRNDVIGKVRGAGTHRHRDTPTHSHTHTLTP
ncbi:UNVERIFIED_CONTAM: hypothetical protein FKN15_017850 [Acipenser sinensis]